MHQGKTGALFKAALRAGAQLAGAADWQVAALTEYARTVWFGFSDYR